MATATHREALARLEANCKRNARIRARAEELVEKTMPRRTDPVPHGFYSFREGMERAAYRGRRDRMVKLTIADLQCADDPDWQADYDAAFAALDPAVLAARDAAQADRVARQVEEAHVRCEARKVEFLAQRDGVSVRRAA